MKSKIPEQDDRPPSLDARRSVLDRLDLLTEEDLALLYECERKTLQNRPRSELPPFFRAGGKRLWFREDVVRYFKNRTGD